MLGTPVAFNLGIEADVWASVGEPVMEGGAEVLLRLWEIVPITGDLLISVVVRDTTELESERADTVESPLALGVTKFDESGEDGPDWCSDCRPNRGVAWVELSGPGSGGSGWESLYCLWADNTLFDRGRLSGCSCSVSNRFLADSSRRSTSSLNVPSFVPEPVRLWPNEGTGCLVGGSGSSGIVRIVDCDSGAGAGGNELVGGGAAGGRVEEARARCGTVEL